MTSFRWWRAYFVLAAVGILTGGPKHPKGTMTEMLGDSNWVPAHSLMLVGFVFLLVGLMLFQSTPLPERTRKWTRFAIYVTVLQAIEMAMHDAAVVDHQHLVLGQPTPVLTTHLWLAVFIYPIFAAVLIALLVAGARDRALGSWWINWLGIIGLIGHGLSAPLVVAAQVPGAGALFPLLAVFGLWMGLAGIWPTSRESFNAVSGNAVA